MCFFWGGEGGGRLLVACFNLILVKLLIFLCFNTESTKKKYTASIKSFSSIFFPPKLSYEKVWRKVVEQRAY